VRQGPLTDPAKPTQSEVGAPSPDYRNAHIGEGEDYHRKFFKHIYRAIIWEIEQRILLDLLGRFLPIPTNARLLDFACGTGRVLALLETRVGTATGIDVSSSMLAVARDELSRSRLVCADITHTAELDSERFDIITAFRFFPNAEPELREAAMAKLSQLLTPDGVLIFNNHLRCDSLRHRLRRLLFALHIKRNRRDLHCMSDREAEALAERHGLALVARYCFGVLPILKERRPLMPAWLIRAIERRAISIDSRTSAGGHAIYVLRRVGTIAQGMDSPACSSN
jgi:SAM-dependent methyltransferase